MSEIKNCPFCGKNQSNGYVHPCENYYPTDDVTKFGVMCEFCGAEIGEFDTPELAIAAWNRRADGWIPVSERLPENANTMLISTGFWGSELTDIGWFNGIEWFNSHGQRIKIVTHWQPLPYAPKGDAK